MKYFTILAGPTLVGAVIGGGLGCLTGATIMKNVDEFASKYDDRSGGPMGPATSTAGHGIGAGVVMMGIAIGSTAGFANGCVAVIRRVVRK